MAHSADHHPAISGRATRLLATLAELTRVSVVAREILAPYQASGRVPQHSLLHELLKGDVELHWWWSTQLYSTVCDMPTSRLIDIFVYRMDKTDTRLIAYFPGQPG